MAPVETSSINSRSQLKENLPSLVMGSQPGFLTLPPSRAKELIAQDPLERWYTVENQPFARGKFAAVKRCRHAETGEVFAAKVIRKRRRVAGLTTESLHEAATLDLCRSCPHIVRLEQVFDAPGETVLVLQLAEGGELQSVLDRDEVPEERDVIRFLSQVLGGLAFLHQFDIAHLDLKPQNLVLTGPFPNCDIKLCDFGIARHIARGADVREILGTPDYVAPEVLNYEPISLATDMWSVGVLAYVLLTGCTPFGGDSKQETFCNITRCQLEFPDDLFQDVSPAAIQFISSLLVQDPSARLTAKQGLEHPWLRGGSSVDSIPTVVSSSEDSCPVSRSSTIVPDDDDDDVANSFHDEAFEPEPAAVVVAAPVTTPPAQQEALQSPRGIPASSQVATFSTPMTRRMESKSKLCVLSEDVSCQQPEPQQTPQDQRATQSPPTATHSSSNFSVPVTRRAGSLPSYRWRGSTSTSTNGTTGNSRREASCDRASDLGYGSDGISEISSTDSSSDRSSIISLEDSPLEWNNSSGPRRYSDTSLAAERLWRRTWERFLPATAGTCVSLPYHLYRDQQPSGEGGRRLSHQPTSLTSSGSGGSIRATDMAPISDDVDSSPRDHHRPWEKVCTGSLARALERFNSPPPTSTGASADVNGSKSSASNGPPAASLTSPVLKSAPVKVSEVRTRLLRGSASGQTQSQSKVGAAAASLTIKAPLLHLDKTEIVKSRLVKFRTAQAATATPLTHHPASSS